MQTILNELYDQYNRFTPNAETLQEIESAHQSLILSLEKPERKLILRIIDNKDLIAGARARESFACGFWLAWRLFSTLLYSSFAKTAVEQRIKGVLRYRRTTALALAASVLVLGGSAVAVATIGQAEFSSVLTSSHETVSGRWLLRGDMTWNVPLGENAQERADTVMVQILSQDTTDDTALMEQQLQTSLAEEFDVPPRVHQRCSCQRSP